MTGHGQSSKGYGESGSLSFGISPGDRVLFIDGRFAGQVLHTNGSCFELDFDGDPIWVAGRSIFNAMDGRVTLLCDADGLYRYIVQS